MNVSIKSESGQYFKKKYNQYKKSIKTYNYEQTNSVKN